MLLLQITEEVIANLIANSHEVTPYNALGYGMTVVILLVVSIKLYFDLRNERQYIIKLNQEVLSITNKYIENSVRFEMAISRTTENHDQMQGLIDMQRELMNQIRELKMIIQTRYTM